jgi:hypothetical protein
MSDLDGVAFSDIDKYLGDVNICASPRRQPAPNPIKGTATDSPARVARGIPGPAIAG